jgi:SAM-dependent methyltransferase
MSPCGACPNCGSEGMSVFYEVNGVPVHSVLLLPTREEALGYPRGDIALGFCQSCGFISNLVFDPLVHEYSSRYESTQAFSPTYNAFARRLAAHLIERYDLHDKDIIEIGCGQGEFLTLLCELGGNRGVGFDPAYVSGGDPSEVSDRITFVKDFYSEEYAEYASDFVCCKMTLEHIQQTADFVSTLRRSIGDRPNTVVFFQVPDVTRILRQLAFWDIYYEHCSYFSPASLVHLFRKCGFAVVDLWKDYDDQYLMIEAQPAGARDVSSWIRQDDRQALARDVAHFSDNFGKALARWREYFQKAREDGRRVAIWGGGSKAVSFLTTLNLKDDIEYVVDINPRKHGTYLAGSGQQMVAPGFLQDYSPDLVLVMNPVYREEVVRELRWMGVTAQLTTVEDR